MSIVLICMKPYIIFDDDYFENEELKEVLKWRRRLMGENCGFWGVFIFLVRNKSRYFVGGKC